MSLAQRQAELLAALVQGAAMPPGFDPTRLQAAARALLHKRRRELLRAWPELAAIESEALGRYLQQMPLPCRGGPLADGRQCVDWLRGQGVALAPALRRHALVVDLRFRRTADGLRPRRGPSVRVMQDRAGWTLGLRLPGGREWHFTLPRRR
jgi:hypothetical protein